MLNKVAKRTRPFCLFGFHSLSRYLGIISHGDYRCTTPFYMTSFRLLADDLECTVVKLEGLNEEKKSLNLKRQTGYFNDVPSHFQSGACDPRMTKTQEIRHSRFLWRGFAKSYWRFYCEDGFSPDISELCKQENQWKRRHFFPLLATA